MLGLGRGIGLGLGLGFKPASPFLVSRRLSFLLVRCRPNLRRHHIFTSRNLENLSSEPINLYLSPPLELCGQLIVEMETIIYILILHTCGMTIAKPYNV